MTGRVRKISPFWRRRTPPFGCRWRGRDRFRSGGGLLRGGTGAAGELGAREPRRPGLASEEMPHDADRAVDAAHHLSADLMLRYLPQILKRARGLDPSDPLVGLLEDVLKRWPLSGVLSDVAEPAARFSRLWGPRGSLAAVRRAARGQRPPGVAARSTGAGVGIL